MSEQSFVGKVKSIWKWLVSGIVAVAVAIGAGVYWLGTAATTSSVVGTVATTGGVVAAAAFTFSFGDKAEGVGKIHKYAKQAYDLVASGKNEQAVQFMDKMVAALDDCLVTLEKETKTEAAGPTTQPTEKKELQGKKIPPKGPPKPRVLQHAIVGRQAAELLRANLHHKAGKLSEDEWLGVYENVFNSNAEKSRNIAKTIVYLAGEHLDAEDVQSLIKKQIPPGPRGDLALWLLQKNSPADNGTVDECIKFYEELLAHTSDTATAPAILSRLIAILDKQKRYSDSDRVLDHFITLFSDSVLGARAAVLRLGGVEPGPSRDAKLVALVEEHPNSAISENLRSAYVAALLNRKQLEKALQAIDEDGLLGEIRTEEDAADVFLALTQKACGLRPTVIRDRSAHGTAKKVPSAQTATPFSICTDLAGRFLDAREYRIAVEFSFAALRSVGSLPLDLITGQPIRTSSDLGSIDNPEESKHIAKYLRALACYVRKDQNAGDRILQELLQACLSKPLRPHVLHLAARTCAEANDLDSAVKYADWAVAVLPNSPVLVALQARVTEAQQQSQVRSRIEKEQKQHLEAAHAATDTNEAVKHYEEFAELSLALDNVEQAVGTYLTIVEKFPNHVKAPAVLAESIELLDRTDQAKNAARIETLTKKLLAEYPDSHDARRFTLLQKPSK